MATDAGSAAVLAAAAAAPAAAGAPAEAAATAAAPQAAAAAPVVSTKTRIEALELDHLGAVAQGPFPARVSVLEDSFGIEPVAGRRIAERLSELESQ